MTKKSDWSVPAVQLNFERRDEVDGKAALVIRPQVFPLEAWDAGLGRLKNDYIVGALVQSFDLEGVKVSHDSAQVRTVPIDANSSNSATRIAWWQERLPALRATTMSNLAVTFVAAYDTEWNVLTTWPGFELVGGQLCEWMPGYEAQEIVLVAEISFDTDGGKNKVKPFKKAVTVKAATPINTEGEWQKFTRMVEESEAEPEPNGMAEYLYLALTTPYWEGSIPWIEREVSGSIGMGCLINIINGVPEWASMGAVVQEVTEDIDTGRTMLRVGVPGYLQGEDLLGLLRWNWRRRVWQNPALRGDSSASGAEETELGKDTPSRDEGEGHKTYEKLRIAPASGTTGVDIDGTNASITLTNGTKRIVFDGMNVAIKFYDGDTLRLNLNITDIGSHVVSFRQEPKCIDGTDYCLIAAASEDFTCP